MSRALTLCVSIMVLAGGCASPHTRGVAPVPTPAAMPAWKADETVGVGVDPYVQPARQTAVFGFGLTQKGVMPVQLFVQNLGDRRLLVRPSDLRLALPDGSHIGPAGVSAVVSKLQKDEDHFWAFFFGGFLGHAAAVSASDKATAALIADYRSKELQELMLGKEESGHGFVYFIPVPGTPAFTDATLRVRFVDPQEATSFVMELGLDGLGFKGTPAK